MPSSRLSLSVTLLLGITLILDQHGGGVSALSAPNPGSNNNNNNNKPKKSKAVLKVQDTKINTSKKSVQFAKPFGGGGGGRKSITADMPNLKEDDVEEEVDPSRWQPTPPKPSEARLTVVQVTDVYTLVSIVFDIYIYIYIYIILNAEVQVQS